MQEIGAMVGIDSYMWSMHSHYLGTIEPLTVVVIETPAFNICRCNIVKTFWGNGIAHRRQRVSRIMESKGRTVGAIEVHISSKLQTSSSLSTTGLSGEATFRASSFRQSVPEKNACLHLDQTNLPKLVKNSHQRLVQVQERSTPSTLSCMLSWNTSPNQLTNRFMLSSLCKHKEHLSTNPTIWLVLSKHHASTISIQKGCYVKPATPALGILQSEHLLMEATGLLTAWQWHRNLNYH